MFSIIFLIFLVLVYLYYTKNFKYWAKKGVVHDKPVIFFGNNVRNYLMRQSRSDAMEEMYWKYPKEKAIGYYRSSKPELILRDPDMIKKVMISDFAYFYSRGFHPNRNAIEPMMRNVAFVEGDQWKMLRKIISPAFTSAKLKPMFPRVLDCANKLQAKTMNAKPNVPIDARDLMGRFAISIVGDCGFSLDADTLTGVDNDFKELCYEFFEIKVKTFVITVLKDMFPTICKGLRYFGEVEKTFFDLADQIKKNRGYKPSGRNDFVDQLYFNKDGPIEIESLEKFSPDGSPEKVSLELDDITCSSQILVLFIAGFGTFSSTSSYTLHQLAFNPEIQKKVQEDIDQVLARHNNKMSYDAVKEMTYLDWTIKESIRQFPALGVITRQCCSEYTFSENALTLDPGVRVLIPVKALHMDPNYWENPEEFRPERFHPDNFTAKQKSVFFPFGEGPRKCLGSVFGKMVSMTGLAAILSECTIEPAPNSVRHPGVDPTSEIVQRPTGGMLPLIFRKRTKN